MEALQKTWTDSSQLIILLILLQTVQNSAWKFSEIYFSFGMSEISLSKWMFDCDSFKTMHMILETCVKLFDVCIAYILWTP